MWDKKTEDMSKEEISDESIQRLKDNLLNLDKHLAPYPYEIWQKWKLLCSQITGKECCFIGNENIFPGNHCFKLFNPPEPSQTVAHNQL